MATAGELMGLGGYYGRADAGAWQCMQGGGVTRSDREHTDDGRVGRGQNANRLSRRFNKLNFNRN